MNQGRIARKVMSLLEAEGFRDIQIQAATGYYRTSTYDDTYRWEGYATRSGDGVRLAIGSWDTMTACAKYGIVVGERGKGDSGQGYEISCKR